MLNQSRKLQKDFFAIQQDWAASPAGVNLLAIWSFLEAICWFILPDYLLLILIVLSPAKAKRFVLISLASSMLGCIVMLTLVQYFPAEIGHFLFTLPFTSETMLAKMLRLEHSYGIASILLQPFSGIPAKAWAYAAISQFHWNPAIFWLLLSIARGFRMAMVATLGWAISKYFGRQLSCSWFIWFLLYTGVFFIFLAKVSE